MPEVKTTKARNYVHLIGGCIKDRRHEAGDLVDPSTPPRKVNEWLKAKIIAVEQTRPKAPPKLKEKHERGS